MLETSTSHGRACAPVRVVDRVVRLREPQLIDVHSR
jgi:hypothetical protein